MGCPVLLPVYSLEHTEQPGPRTAARVPACHSHSHSHSLPPTLRMDTAIVLSEMCLCRCKCCWLPAAGSPSPVSVRPLLLAIRSHLTALLLCAQILTPLPDIKDLHMMGLAGGQALSQPGLSRLQAVGLAGSLPGSSSHPRLVRHPTWPPRGRQASHHEGPPLDGDSGNTQQIAVDAASLTETEKLALSLVRPRARLGEGDHGEWGPTLPGHSQPPAQKGKQLLGSHLPMCGPALSPNKNTRNTNSPGERAGEELGGVPPPRPPQNQHQSTKQPFRPTPRLPPLTSRPQNQAREKGVSSGCLCLWGRGGPGQHRPHSPLERWIQVCWLSLRKKPLWH